MNLFQKISSRFSIVAQKAMGRLPQATWRAVAYEFNPRVFGSVPPRMDFLVIKHDVDRKLVVFGRKHEFWLPSACELNQDLWWEYLSVFWSHLANRHYYFRHMPSFPQDAVVLDCGAFCGFFTRLALESGAGKVVSIEPNPNMRACLGSTFSKEIAEGKVVLKQAALSQSPCSLKFKDETFAPFGGAISNTEGCEVKGICLDHFVNDIALKELHFLKMDIEGFEIQALLGAEGSLRRFHPQLSVTTYHRCADYQMLANWLKTLGYNHVVPSGLCYRKKDISPGLRPVMIYAWN